MKIALKNILFTILVPGTVGVYLPLYFGMHSAGVAAWWNWIGIPFLATGFGVLLVCIRDFGTNGQGTPFPLDPPQNLVTGRLYRITRNPMYVGLMIALTGWTLWFSSIKLVGYGLTTGLIVHLFVVHVEEPFLKRQFGNAYEAYCKQVPRWL